jgi:hydrogenase maturation factor
MCMASILQVKKVLGTKAIMEDDREVLLGPIQNVKKGAYLRVYTDIAIDKVSTKKG